jgi:excisionase family DNA binding protein
MTDERLYTKSDAASYLGVSEKTIDRWVKTTKLMVTKRVGNSPRWTKGELDAALSERQPEQ